MGCGIEILKFIYPTLSLVEKVQAVEAVFRDLDEAISKFQGWSTLYCKFGCGKCCFKADIEATVLEFIPFAHYLYQQDLAFDWLNKLKQTDSSLCLILNPTSSGAGLCSEYPYRGLICRLFGYSARTDKYGVQELVTCQIIKTEQSGAYEQTAEKVRAGEKVPVMNQYYMKLHAIDHDLAQNFYPINEAIKRAIETVLHYYAYRVDNEKQ
ncbi:MAG: YkgJ family cysteine cluster protein [Bacteroidota bacterium]